MPIVSIDAANIVDWNSFHTVFATAFGFPEFYGRNMDAWIDCMSWLDDPDAGMTTVHTRTGNVVTLHIENVDDFVRCCPEQYAAIVECTAFVNWRRVHIGEDAVLALSYTKTP